MKTTLKFFDDAIPWILVKLWLFNDYTEDRFQEYDYIGRHKFSSPYWKSMEETKDGRKCIVKYVNIRKL